MWRMWHRKTYLTVGVLVLALVGGIMSPTAYARFQESISSRTFHNTFVGVSEPVNTLPQFFDVDLVTGGRFISRKRVEMKVKVINTGFTIVLSDQIDCGNGVLGWCITSRDQSWVFQPQLGGQFAMIDNAILFTGQGRLTQLDGGSTGMATYRALIERPATDDKGLRIMIDLDGFSAKVKTHEED